MTKNDKEYEEIHLRLQEINQRVDRLTEWIQGREAKTE